MSLIHKALKKAMGGDAPPTAEPPVETFAGAKKPDWKDQFTPRTMILLGVAILALIFMIYKKFIRSDTTFKGPQPLATAVQPAPAVPKPGEVAPSLQQPSGDATDSLKVPASDVSTDELINEGQKLYAAGKYDDALAKFVESQGKNPNNPAVYNNIGLVYKKKNNFSQAENYYKKALAIKPDYAECLNNMGVLKAAAGDTLEAALYLKKAISVVSTYADAYFNLAVLNDEEGNFKEAIANYKSFLLYTETSDESLITKVKDRIDQISE